MLSLIPQPAEIVYGSGSTALNAEIIKEIDPALSEEAYRIRIADASVRLTGGSEKGLVHAENTLRQIRFQCRGKGEYPALQIEDAPAYPFRSFHVDVSRHFFSVAEMKKFIDAAALFRLNTLHWHLSDDQGWRLESKAFPKLQEISAFRDGDYFGAYRNDEREGGFYTRKEIKEFVDYAAERGIDVIPEIDLPGHVTAILAAYPGYSCSKKPMKVRMRQGITNYILCAGRESTFDFVEALLTDVMELFPSKYFHIGGDEAPKREWAKCPDCRKKLRELGIADPETASEADYDALQGYFTNRVVEFLLAHGKTPIVWNEAAWGKNLDPRIVVQYWVSDRDQSLAVHVGKGGKVLYSPMPSCYCDYPYGFITMQKLHDIDLLPADLIGKGPGFPMPNRNGDAPKLQKPSLSEEDKMRLRETVIGTEALLWTELVRTEPHLEGMAWPRYAAIAEAAWCGDRRPDYADFTDRIRKLFPIFSELGIQARTEEYWNPESPVCLEELLEFQENFFYYEGEEED